MSNDAMMKALAVHCKCMSKAHEAASSAHQSLSECFKAEQAEGLHKGMKDMHADLQSCHKSMAESYGKLGDACKKDAGENNDIEKLDAGAIATTVVDTLRKEFGNTIMPSMVKGVLPSNPVADAGLQLVGRSGSMAAPTNPERLGEFAHLFQE